MTIEDLIPSLRAGWVAMDEDKNWMWFSHEPSAVNSWWRAATGKVVNLSLAFDIEPAPYQWFYTKTKVR